MMERIIITSFCLFLFCNKSIAQNRFGLSFGVGSNLSSISLDTEFLEIGTSQKINSNLGVSIFLNSDFRLSRKFLLNTRIMYFTNSFDYEFTDLSLPGEAFQDYSVWEVNAQITERGISMSPGIRYLFSDILFFDYYISFSRFLSSESESNYLTIEVPFEVSGTENNSTSYNQVSSILQLGLNLKKLIMIFSMEVYHKEREIFFPKNFISPTGSEIRFMLGLGYKI